MADPKKPVDLQAEIEHQVGELEERVDRLRAMYEQYFMGYEKLEPTVARRDVDRRFAQLRKQNIRNTALRWRFNVVTQKFNTYSMYWTRICRQIEEGTFKRHIARAKQRFGPGARRPGDDLSIDVDFEDFEVDMDDFDSESETADALAEAEAHAAQPTEPPPRSIPKAAPRLDMGRMEAQTDRPTAPPGFAEDDASPGSIPPGSVPGHRVARHVVLPAGLKQRVLVKKGPVGPRNPDAAPASTPTPTPQPSPSPVRADGELPPMRRPMPSAPENAPSTSVIRAAPQHVHRSPAGVVRPQISPSANSVNRVPVAKPVGPASVERIPAAAPTPSPAPSVQRVPAAAPNPSPSVRNTPAAPPSQRSPAVAPNPSLGRPPSTSPAAGPGPASTPRVPTAGRVPIGLPSGSAGRVPVAPPSDAKTAPPPAAPQSERKLPIPPSQRTPLARPGGPMPAAPPMRPPAPSAPDSERNPVPSRRPPPPLPSQLKKP